MVLFSSSLSLSLTVTIYDDLMCKTASVTSLSLREEHPSIQGRVVLACDLPGFPGVLPHTRHSAESLARGRAWCPFRSICPERPGLPRAQTGLCRAFPGSLSTLQPESLCVPAPQWAGWLTSEWALTG